MAISYEALAIIGSMTNDDLLTEWHEQTRTGRDDEDTGDIINALETEMEQRGMPHP